MSLRVFVSATTGELGRVRSAVDEELRHQQQEPVVQDFFPPDYRTVAEMLQSKVADCDVVICLVGQVHGFCPANAPDRREGMSYTQMEYYIAQEDCDPPKPTFVFLLTEDFALDATGQKALAEQTPEARAKQEAHRQALGQGDRLYLEVGSQQELISAIARIQFHTIAPQRPQAAIQNLPFAPLGHLFKGREEEVAQLEGSLSNDSGLVVHQAVKGLGGIGKTRLAVEYAWANRNRYHALLFVTADSPDNLRSDLAGLAGLLYPELKAQLKGVPEDQALDLTLQWLNDHPGWLLILDNVDANEQDNPAVEAVRQILPRLNQGHVLITSRWNHWYGLRTISLGHLEPDASTAYLLEATEERSRQAKDAADARAIAETLEGLALALEQAAAYIDVQAISFAAYRGLLEEKQEQVLAWHDSRFTDYPNAVATTWLTTIDKLAPPARALLNLLAWFAPAPIPEFLLDHEKGAHYFKEALRVSGLADPEREWTLRDALAELRSYSLVRAETDAGFDAFGLHRLVLDVSRLQIPEDERQQWLEWALRWVDWAVPHDTDDVRTWDVMDPLHVHAEAIAWQANKEGIMEPTSRLMSCVGTFFWAKALYAQAEPLYRRAIEIGEAKLGADHPDVAVWLNNLANLLHATGRAEEAEPLFRRALEIGETNLGPDHPHVATYLISLAILLQETGRAEEAERLYRRAIEIDEAKFGPDHPEVAIDLNNLATLLRETGRAEEAERLYRRAIEIGEAKLGLNHPEVARWLMNLGSLLRETDRYEEAEPMLRRAVAIFQATLGEDHPSTQRAKQHLERLLGVRGSP